MNSGEVGSNNTNDNKNTSLLTARDTELLSSYVVSYEIAKSLKSSTEGDLIKRCITSVGKIMCPEKIDSFNKIKLSARTVQRITENIAKLIDNENKSKLTDFVAYSLALDESADITDTAQLVIFIRGCNEDLEVNEYLLDLIPLKGNTTGEDLFRALYSTIQKYNLDLNKLVSIITDGAPAMIGTRKGLVGRVKQHLKDSGIGEHLKFFHCIIHQEALCAKVISMQHVMTVVINTINLIKSKSLKHRQFRKILKDLGEECDDLCYYTEVRWLSGGKMLQRFFHLKDAIQKFMSNQVTLFQ